MPPPESFQTDPVVSDDPVHSAHSESTSSETSPPASPSTTPVTTAGDKSPLAHYAPPLLTQVWARWQQNSGTPDATATAATNALERAELETKLYALLSDWESAQRQVAELEVYQRQALALLWYGRAWAWRWDQAVRLLEVCQLKAPYHTLQSLLQTGWLVLLPATVDGVIQRFEVPDSLPTAALPRIQINPWLDRHPFDFRPELHALRYFPVAVTQSATTAAHLTMDSSFDQPAPTAWRQADGWDLPLRLAMVWRQGWQQPFKHTQQGTLFKRDLERLTQEPLLNTASLDGPEVGLLQPGLLAFHLACALGILTANGTSDGHQPTATLETLWPEDLSELTERIATELLQITAWNELGDETPPGSFREAVPINRYLLLLWIWLFSDPRPSPAASQPPLATTTALSDQPVDEMAPEIDAVANEPEEQETQFAAEPMPSDMDLPAPAYGACRITDLARRLEKFPPWSETGERLGPLRQAQRRQELVFQWTRAFLLGPMWQTGMVALAPDVRGAAGANAASNSEWVRLTAAGRHLLRLQPLPEPAPAFPQTLLVQPNHQVVVYRQGLQLPLLSRLLLLAEPRSFGAALTFEITAHSVYQALEAGLTEAELKGTLQHYGGRDLPGSVVDAIRTWSQKRARLSFYTDASLFEFYSPADLQEAVARGLVGIPLTPTLLLVESEHEQTFKKQLRYTATRDYRFPGEPCIRVAANGIHLQLDRSRSDLMIESELNRFAESWSPVADERTTPTASVAPPAQEESIGHFQVTPESIGRAVQQGMLLTTLEQWFQERAGQSLPAAILLLWQMAQGMSVQTRTLTVLTVAQPLVADGLLQHPATADLFESRLGPVTLAVHSHRLEQLREQLRNWNIDWQESEPTSSTS